MNQPVNHKMSLSVALVITQTFARNGPSHFQPAKQATARNPRYDGRFINQPAKRATAIDATSMMIKARTMKNCRPHLRA
jgi:hypothetical protein